MNNAWKSFTSQDGLLSNLIYSAAIDLKGGLWFGCKNLNGVSRFDGKNWQNFDSVQSGIGSGHVWSITVDQQNNIWFATAGGGISKYSGRSWTTYTMKHGLAGNYVYAVRIGPDGLIWCGCAPKPDSIVHQGGVSVFDGTGFTNYTSDYTQGEFVGGGNSALCDNRVYAIAFDQQNRVWFGTKGGGICCFSQQNWVTFDTTNGLPVNEVGDGATAVDCEGNVWFGLRGGGACRFQDSNIKIFSMKDGLAGDFVYAIENGPDGKLWFGCSPDPAKVNKEGGISIFDGKSFLNYTSDYVGGKYVGGGNSPLVDNRVYAIVFDHEGNGWFGTKGGGVSRLASRAIRS